MRGKIGKNPRRSLQVQVFFGGGSMIGWQGYCIERDSSISLYGNSKSGNTTAQDQACLTWLPVDQLTGATDLYGKYTSAGYVPQETLFCAEIGLAYDIGPSDYFCAKVQFKADTSYECQDSNEDEGVDVTDFYDDAPYNDVYCPKGSFAVIAGCGKAAPGDECQNYIPDAWPYFCVPKWSYHTQGSDAGKPCELPPDDPKVASVTSIVHMDGGADHGSGNGVDIYVMHNVTGDDWSGIRSGEGSYEDCKVRGVFGTDPAFSQYSWYNHQSLYPYAACKSLVQVSTPDHTKSNAAWTNRIWENGGYHVASSKGKGTTGVSCAETDGITYCSDPGDDNPWGDVNCPADYFAVLGPCDDLGLCKHAVEDNDYPYFCVPKSSFKVDADGTHKSCDLPAGAPSNNHGGTDIYFMDAGAWNTAHTKYDGCYTDLPGYSAKTIPTIFGRANKISSKTDKLVSFDPSPHRLLSCKTGNTFTPIQVDTAGNQNICPTGTTQEGELEEAKGYYNNQFNGVDYQYTQPSPLTPMTSDDSLVNAAKKLQSLFAQSYQLFTFNKGSLFPQTVTNSYKQTFSAFDTATHTANQLFGIQNPVTTAPWKWDLRMTGETTPGGKKPTAPKVISIGQCLGAKCKEGKEGRFTVNDRDIGNVLGTGGSKHVTVSFFTAADPDQMPIRKIITDWGDDNVTNGMPWPTGSQSGSTALDNFYKNARGLNTGGDEICGSNKNFGETLEACSSNFVVFNHDYVCSAGLKGTLKTCEKTTDGRLLNSPCTDGKSCVYQPRVYVEDNWGWCTGFCNAGSDNTNGCFSGGKDDVPPTEKKNNECQFKNCPSEGKNPLCPDTNVSGKTDNPWVNYNGYVIVDP